MKSYTGTLFAFCFLIVGLIGMSHYSSPPSSYNKSLSSLPTTTATTEYEDDADQEEKPLVSDKKLLKPDGFDDDVIATTISPSRSEASSSPTTRKNHLSRNRSFRRNKLSASQPTDVSSVFISSESIPTVRRTIVPMELDESADYADDAIPFLDTKIDHRQYDNENHNNNNYNNNVHDDNDKQHDTSRKDSFDFFGGSIVLSRRQVGIIGAVINGSWGGMNLIPLHFAMKQNDGMTGAGYVISYACGSMIINVLVWILLFLYYLFVGAKGDVAEAVSLLPKWRYELILPGVVAGLLYSCGNFASILAIAYLGQGTGGSFCQMQLFISGLWGILYFKEIRGYDSILKWFLSAFIAFVGIIWLSYEHEKEVPMHR